jgi:hydrogenase expression/formation protein HypE
MMRVLSVPPTLDLEAVYEQFISLDAQTLPLEYFGELREKDIPVRQEVRGICEILGFDPLFLANEGKVALFCAPADAVRVLDVMKAHEYGREAAIIGAVGGRGRGRLVLRTAIGGSREVDLPVGELVPRIC